MKMIFVGLIVMMMFVGCNSNQKHYSVGESVVVAEIATTIYKEANSSVPLYTAKKGQVLSVISGKTNDKKSKIHIRTFDMNNGYITGFVLDKHVVQYIPKKEEKEGYIPLDAIVTQFPLRKQRIIETSIRLNESEYIRLHGKTGIVKILGCEYIHTDYLHWLSKEKGM